MKRTLLSRETDFVDLQDGDTMELVAGPQGGWHLDVSHRGTGFSPDLIPLKTWVIVDED